MDVVNQFPAIVTEKLPQLYRYPDAPFESIGFALSGGGFRAATFGLGVLSLLNEIKWTELEKEVRLLEKVRFVSSASGGTITLSVYTAALHHGVPFTDYYRKLNEAMRGEALVEEAMKILNDESQWQEGGKSRNIINAFSRAYHNKLFAFIPEKGRTLGGIMPGEQNGGHPSHIEEFCFNSTDFYTGVVFRFQGGEDWSGNKGGALGNSNIGIDWKKKENAVKALKNIRLSDVLAASSCFPMGFEPIVFPRDFTYPGGPAVKDLKDALVLDTLSWNDKLADPDENLKSPRAKKEKEFAEKKVFGLMDGGIWDNQGLHSLLLANGRGKVEGEDSELHNRFDLMMVSDVTSFYMSPYNVPEIKTDKSWMRKSLAGYWQDARGMYKKVNRWMSLGVWIGVLLAVVCALPLVLEGVSVASIALSALGFLALIVAIIIKSKYRKFLSRKDILRESLEQESLADLVMLHMKEDSFPRRTAVKVVNYLQSVNTGTILQMVNARVQSAAIMIGDIFLKHIRRLIYEQLFTNPRYIYRRLDNMIYKLTYTNNKNRSFPAFEPIEKEDPAAYKGRRDAFRKEVSESCLLSPEMQRIAELAYNTGTTMWFENEQEAADDNNRKALIATGQFTTCYNLLGYTLGLRHSRHFINLDTKYQQRIDEIIRQLKFLMVEFQKDPYYLYKKLE